MDPELSRTRICVCFSTRVACPRDRIRIDGVVCSGPRAVPPRPRGRGRWRARVRHLATSLTDPPSSGAGDSDLERRVHSQSQIELHALTESTREEEEFEFRSISVRVIYRVQQAGRQRQRQMWIPFTCHRPSDCIGRRRGKAGHASIIPIEMVVSLEGARMRRRDG
jgi:hypothetical protein